MHSQSLKLAVGSLVVGMIVLALKYAAYWITGSVALYSDAVESIVNVVTAGVALLAVRIAAKPADANHPFGHHKVEYFSAVIEGVMIVVAALLVPGLNILMMPAAVAGATLFWVRERGEQALGSRKDIV